MTCYKAPYNTVPLAQYEPATPNLKSSILPLSHSAALLTYLNETDHDML